MQDRYQYIIDGASTAIILLDKDLTVDYVNDASLDLLQAHQREVRKVYPEFDIEKLVGINLTDIRIISRDALDKFRGKNRKKYARFLDVGEEKIHITVYPITGSDGIDQGSAIEWWYATEYLAAQEHAKKIADITNLIDDLTFQANILSLNAAVEAAHAGEHGRSFAVIANEMRNLSQRCRDAAKEINVNIIKNLDE